MITVQAIVFPFSREDSRASELLAGEIKKYHEDGTRDWRGVPERISPWILDVDADEIVTLDQDVHN